ncbi:MAG: hypothetical protein NC390_00935 [Fusobacterium sp.]|nr:hypothetical protein [Fusobacterium sp.]
MLVVQKAQAAVFQVEERIRQNEQEILDTKTGMRSADPRMFEYYDKYLDHLWEKAEKLQQELVEAQRILNIEKQKLVKLEQGVKVLEKHKEKSREAYLAEEKAAELKQYSELGVTRFFRQSQERAEEEEAQILKQLQELDQ